MKRDCQSVRLDLHHCLRLRKTPVNLISATFKDESYVELFKWVSRIFEHGLEYRFSLEGNTFEDRATNVVFSGVASNPN